MSSALKSLVSGKVPMLRSKLMVAAALITLIELAACANVLELAENPQLVDTGPWRCVKKPLVPEPPSNDKAVVRVHVCNFVSSNCSEAVTGLTASLCNKRDVNCASPIRSDIEQVGGDFSFTVPTGGDLGVGFDGYLQIRSPTALCTDESAFGPGASMLCALTAGCDPAKPDDRCRLQTYSPSLLFFNPPVRADLAEPLVLPLIPTSAALSLTQAAGGDIDPTTGNVFITARDCDDKPAAGARFGMTSRNDDKVTILYVSDGVISNSAVATDESGIGGLLGVPAGFSSIAGFAGVDGSADTKFGEIGLQVAPFNITYATLAPAVAK
jgi:hypothetical protein